MLLHRLGIYLTRVGWGLGVIQQSVTQQSQHSLGTAPLGGGVLDGNTNGYGSAGIRGDWETKISHGIRIFKIPLIMVGLFLLSCQEAQVLSWVPRAMVHRVGI